MTRNWVAIPNFVDPDIFCPGNRNAARARFGITGAGLVVGCVAAVKASHKRVDYLVRECSVFNVQCSAGSAREGTAPINHQPSTINHDADPFLLIAGARTDESEEVLALAAERLPRRHRILVDYPHEGMPELYRAMDVFVLPSLLEMMPIAVIEAMASGVPVIANRHSVLEWIVGGEEVSGVRCQSGPRTTDHGLRTTDYGPRTTDHRPSSINHALPAGGACIDMSKDGELARTLSTVSSDWIAQHGYGARSRALALFSKREIVHQYIEYYRRVMQDGA